MTEPKFFKTVWIESTAKKPIRMIRLWWFRNHRIDLSDAQAVSYAVSLADPVDVSLLPYVPSAKKIPVHLHLDVLTQINTFERKLKDVPLACQVVAAALFRLPVTTKYTPWRDGLAVKNADLSPSEKAFLLDTKYDL